MCISLFLPVTQKPGTKELAFLSKRPGHPSAWTSPSEVEASGQQLSSQPTHMTRKCALS